VIFTIGISGSVRADPDKLCKIAVFTGSVLDSKTGRSGKINVKIFRKHLEKVGLAAGDILGIDQTGGKICILVNNATTLVSGNACPKLLAGATSYKEGNTQINILQINYMDVPLRQFSMIQVEGVGKDQ